MFNIRTLTAESIMRLSDKWAWNRRPVILLLAAMSMFVLVSLCGDMGSKLVRSSSSFSLVRRAEGHEGEHHDNERGKPLLRDFGPRNQYRAAHIAARLEEEEFLPFNATLVLPMFRPLERMEVEVEYFRFRDHYGLIDAELNDSDLLFLLQTVVDTYAQANVYLRIRPKEALAFVDLTEQRAKAYWYYVDYPRGKPVSAQAKERKRVMDQVIGRDMIKMLDNVDKRDYNGVLDWVLGLPFERTRWEHRNVVAIYPTYFFAHMNGAGQTNCLRFRTGDCTAPKTLKNLPVAYEVKTKCLHFRGNATVEEDEEEEAVVVREWEKEPMTRHRLIRLIAHEMGHALKLQHIISGKKCVELKNWQEGNVMNQIRQMHLEGTRCKSAGYPIEAADAMKLWPKQGEKVREGLRADLRQTPLARGMHRLGKPLETTVKPPASDRLPIFGFVAQQINLTAATGRVRRVSWKSGNLLQLAVNISVGRFDENNNTWVESASQSVLPHTRGAHLHQEHEVDLPISVGEFVAVIGSEDLAPDSHVYDNAQDLLIKDLTPCIPQREVIHVHMNSYFNRVDKDKVRVKKAELVPGMLRMTSQQREWEPVSTTEWLVNFDLLVL